ncbi:MAG: carbohydrate ABC transporter permease [Oscillospiraceae bacterium]|jgi:putative aldouronate transport system permease protein|nr:carbohydrate ABC transporter permease [Oscillospiraceae bacterium]
MARTQGAVLRSNRIRRSFGLRAFTTFNYVFLVLFALITFYPFWYILIASFNMGRDFARGGVYLFPRAFTLDNYKKAFENKQIVDAFLISVGRTSLGVVLGLFFTSLMSYGIHIRTLPGRTGIVLYFFITTIVSGGMIPYFLLLRALGLTKSFWIYVWPSIFSFYNMILVRTYFDGIPPELRESARIDGAGEWRTLLQIYLPTSVPVLATIALFIGVGHWNDWFTGAYYVTNQKIMPAATLLQKILLEASSQQSIKPGQESSIYVQAVSTTPQSMQMAFVMILTMPIVVVYPFLQKYYVKGVMVGSVKG